MDPGIDFEFTATFEVFPNIDVADLSKVNLKHPQAEINDDDLEAMIQRLREQRQTFEPVERAVADGDEVTVDFRGTLDGEVLDGTEGEDMKFRVGQGQMIEDFDKGVLGVAPGESADFDATFPEDYRAEALQGQTVQFHVTVKSVAEATLPELDDEFFAGLRRGGGRRGRVS